MYIYLILFFSGAVICEPTIYLKEEFLSENSLNNWIESTYKGEDQGKFSYSAGNFYNDAIKDKGIKTSQDAKFYDISYKLENPFTNKDKILVIQYQVKHEQSIDCGGGYIKILGKDINQKSFHGGTPYEIMFGPNICGYTNKKVHVIFNYKGKNLLIKKEISCKDDEFTHLYTLILRPNNTYEVLIDNEKAESGNLEEDWDFLAPKQINDPSVKKPENWIDEEKIPDPNDTKPENWDTLKTIPDPASKKPEDWDNEMDGEWEAPNIDNPEFKGEWKAKEIDNLNYKGPWIHPQIDNPEYKSDPDLYLRGEIGAVGFDLWQVKSGSIFDNILITDDAAYAKEYATDTWKNTADGEKTMKNNLDKEELTRKEKDSEQKKKEDETVDRDEIKSSNEEIKEDTKEEHTEL